LRTDLSFIANLNVIDNSYLTGQGHLVANLSASRNTCLGSNDGIFSNAHVVRDLDQIIYFGSSTYNGPTQGRSIHSRIGPDLHIILDFHEPDLWDFNPLRPFSGITEPISTNHNASMKDDTIADATILAHRNL
jgi:hypothetical protein